MPADFLMPNTESTLFCSPTGSNSIRGSDSFGQGRFGASRGVLLHTGVDYNVEAGGDIYSPIFGKIIRVAVPTSQIGDLRG